LLVFGTPTLLDRIDGELRCVARGADEYTTAVRAQILDPVGNGQRPG
jgi:hypothetical protein